MAENDEVLGSTPEPETSPAPRPKAPPIDSRFLYVDVAAMRAKQLRRGAIPRIDEDDLGEHRTMPHKAERIAMEEVRRGLVLYEVPGPLRSSDGQ
ncbi:MAG TPA: DNA-directed RNA polymerase subunit omega [Vicinamibacterales bacterium]